MAETKTPDPTTGRIVQYVLSDADVDRIDGPQHLWIADAAEGERSGEWQYPAKV